MDGSQQAIDRLNELTNGEVDEEVARSVLSSVDWDVQRAADLLFGHTPATMQPLDVDDSLQPTPRPRHRPLWSWLTLPFHLLTSIVRFIFGVLRIPLPRFATLTFYLPLSRRGNSASAPPKGPEAWLRQLEDETGAISVGRIRPRASASGVASSTATSSTAEASLTSRARATGDDDPDTDGRKRLPDFMLSSYEDFLRACQRDARIGCVILVSAEHDDVPEFKRSTLTDPALIKAFQDNNILVWGGDVRDREAWSASEKLQATTYPFVAFLALQPHRGTRTAPLLSSTSSSPSNDPILTVLSRHQGPAALSAYTPAPSPSTSTSTPTNAHDHIPTSAPALLTHLQSALLPRIAPYLSSLHTARASASLALQRTRQLRAEQDAAFAASAARDRARIEARIAEEREARERAAREKEAEERRVREETARRQERERREMERGAWRAWARRALVQPLKDASSPSSTKYVMRLAVRLPSGARIVHTFDVSQYSTKPQPTLTTLFALVDAAFIPDSQRAADDPALPPVITASSPDVDAKDKPTPESILDAHILSLLGSHPAPTPTSTSLTSSSSPISPSVSSSSSSPSAPTPTAETTFWSFRLLTAYPRAEVRWAPNTHLSTVSLLNPPAFGSSGKNANQGGAQLVVELVSSSESGTQDVEGRRSGEGRRSSEGRKSAETARRSVDADNGLPAAQRGSGTGGANGHRDTGGSSKGKGKDAQIHNEKDADEEDSDDGYRTESSDEE